MGKEKIKKLWTMIEYVCEKNNLDFNEMVVFGSVFGQLESEILRLQEVNKEIEKLYEGGILDIECLKDDAEEKQAYIDELKLENEKIRWSGTSWDPGLTSKVKVLKSCQQVREE